MTVSSAPSLSSSAPPPVVPVVLLLAGGGALDGLERLLGGLLPGGAAVVLAVPGNLAQLSLRVLEQVTDLPVTELSMTELSMTGQHRPGPHGDGHMQPLPLQAGRLYVAQGEAARQLRLGAGQVWLDSGPAGLVLRDLAEHYGPAGYLAVLSGEGTLDTAALQAVRRAGGTVLVQDPGTAQYPDLPLQALPGTSALPAATVLADTVLAETAAPTLPPEALSALLGSRLGGTALTRRQATWPVPPQGLDAAEPGGLAAQVTPILDEVRAVTGHDFSLYSLPAVLRRLDRRLQALGLADLGAYLDYLRGDPAEAAALAHRLLPAMTTFFRDPAAFAELAGHLRQSLSGAEGGRSAGLRAWVCGCASGEEAYSVAIVLAEVSAALGLPPAQVMATDLSRPALQLARRGVYSAQQVALVGADRLAQFFQPVAGGVQVAESLRRAVTFFPHDVLRDAPLEPADVVLCRNLLPYLSPLGQETALGQLRQAVRPGGLLLLEPGAAALLPALAGASAWQVRSRRWALLQRRGEVGPSQAPLEPGLELGYTRAYLQAALAETDRLHAEARQTEAAVQELRRQLQQARQPRPPLASVAWLFGGSLELLAVTSDPPRSGSSRLGMVPGTPLDTVLADFRPLPAAGADTAAVGAAFWSRQAAAVLAGGQAATFAVLRRLPRPNPAPQADTNPVPQADASQLPQASAGQVPQAQGTLRLVPYRAESGGGMQRGLLVLWQPGSDPAGPAEGSPAPSLTP